MRITFVYRYFWPDTAPYGLLLAEMIPALVDAGHEVSVIAGYPAYGPEARKLLPPKYETIFGAKVRRMTLLPETGIPGIRGLNMTLFSISAFLKLLFGPRSDMYWAGSTPPVVQALLVGLAAKIRNGKMIYQIQDIHPEIGIHSGRLRSGALTKILTFMDNQALRLADRVTVLSTDMADVVMSRSGVEPTVINNFALGVTDAPIRKKTDKLVRFVFAGNIGTFQNLDKFVAAFAAIPPDLAELHFVGDGKAKARLIAQTSDSQHIHFHDRMSAEEVFVFLSRHDVGVVSLDPGLYRLAYPTKLHVYFAAGLKVFALLEEESKLALLIRKYDAGDVVGWGNPTSIITDRLVQLAQRLQMGDSGDPVPRELWHRNDAMKRWLALLEDLT